MKAGEYLKLSEVQPVSMHDDWFEIADADHFWIIWRWKSILANKSIAFKPGSILLEIGCGNGIAMHQFETDYGITVDGCDLNELALSKSVTVNGRKFLYNIFDFQEQLVGKYDGIILLDVIEHIDDPLGFIKASSKYLKKNGMIIINVPAYQWLYSSYDRAVGHVHRYTKKELRSLLIQAGFDVKSISYWGASMIPIALLRKWIYRKADSEIISKGFKPPGKLADTFLRTLMSTETSLPFRLPFGTSAIAVGVVNQTTNKAK
jgi:SAM-dependent methyltransferase